MSSKRYRIDHDTWTREDVHTGHTPEGEPFFVLIESADITDTRDGRLYRGGASRVRADVSAGPKPRTRTFIGETAHHKANALALEYSTGLLYRGSVS